MFERLFSILYEDNAVLVVNKPAGLLVQAPPGIDSLVGQIKAYLQQKDGLDAGSDVYLGVPHRLDRPATGCMIFARNARAAKRLSDQFQMRMVVKKYWVLVEGLVPDDAGDWEDFIRKVPDEARAEIVSSRHTEGRWAMLHYRVQQRFSEQNCTWLEIQLETGRTHQIRIQAASRGFPVLGDTQYGATTLFGFPFEDERLRAIALHSRSLDIRHPTQEGRIFIEAAPSADWRDYTGMDF